MMTSPWKLIAVAFLVTASAQAQTFQQDRRDFNAALNRQCPQKHLEYLIQDDLTDRINSFSASLKPEMQVSLARATQQDFVSLACTSLTEGMGCINEAFIIAATKLKLMSDFIKTMCALPISCDESSEACARLAN